MPELNLIVLRSSDLERAARFYGALGIELSREKHGTGTEHLAGHAGPVLLEIYPQAGGEGTSKIRVGFRVDSVTALIPVLQQTGGAIVSPPQQIPWGLRAVVADPDGHRVELVERPNSSR